jgi:hypothetical protein
MLIARKARGAPKLPTPAKPHRPKDLAAAATKRRSRGEILALVRTMADELDGRAGTLLADLSPGVMPTEAAACQRAARHLREVISIAQGRRSSAYWQFRPQCQAARRG